MGTRTESRTRVRRPPQKARCAMMGPWASETGIEAVLDTLKGKAGHSVVDEVRCVREREGTRITARSGARPAGGAELPLPEPKEPGSSRRGSKPSGGCWTDWVWSSSWKFRWRR